MKKDNIKKIVWSILMAALAVGLLCGCGFNRRQKVERPVLNPTESYSNVYNEEVVETTEEETEPEYGAIKKEDAVLGNIVKFGLYEQDNNFDNGSELIEWRVIEVRDDRVMLITEKCIDAKAFDTTDTDTWEGSSLRSWLNKTFYNMAFPQHKETILETNLTNSRGDDTNDFVFLLDIKQVKDKLYIDEIDMSGAVAYCTEYAASKEDSVNPGDAVSWWLRSQPAALWCTQTVTPSGKIVSGGLSIWYDHIYVRPVIIVGLE